MPPAPKTTQDEPTAPMPQDAAGRYLDEWGLPLLGPDRIAALNGRTDPLVDPAGWTTPAPAAAATPPAQQEG